MQRNSKKNKIPQPPTTFKSETEEADWFASPAGQKYAEHILAKSIREGTIKFGTGIPSAAKLEAMYKQARAKMTRPVSLRIVESDIVEAKRIASKKGIGYQTVLKLAIREGLRRA